jgi:two-component system NarL family sensor kinase
MGSRTRWSALVVGVVYVGVGVLGWVRSETGDTSAVPTALIVLGLWGAIAILAVGIYRPDVFQLTTQETGPWLAVALAAPLTLLPFRAPDSTSTLLLVTLWPLSQLPLGIALGGSPSHRNGTWSVTAALAAVAFVVGLLTWMDERPDAAAATIHLAAITAVALVPALISAVRAPGRDPRQAGQVLIGLAPLASAFVLAVPSTGLVVLVVGLTVIVVVNRASVRPLTRAATQAITQRDLTVAAVESERRRLAADIHDGPLQSILLLGQQLEAEGHMDAATTARAVGVELRDLAGELRLPMLDDLGVGPALDWLAERAQRMTGMLVSVDYEGLRRPPPDVELATFRIAQEAMANALRHGQPPIRIMYRTDGESLTLSVDDEGQGFSRSMRPGSGGHGLLNMRLRADAIGARLELLHRPDRGTHVGVEWPTAST